MEYGFASEIHREFPPMLVVSITNVCNMKCVHCHHRAFAKRPDYQPNYMGWEIWTKICDEASQYPWTILNLATDGEPLLHKQLVGMLRYAKDKGIYPINITTNGSVLTEDLAPHLIGEGLLDVINVSLDAHSPEKYHLLGRGERYWRVHRNVSWLVALRDKLNPSVKIQVNIIDQPEVRDELDEFVRYWEPRVDNVIVRTYYDATHVTGATGPDITGKQKAFEDIPRWPCQQFWRRFNIVDDGVARFCVDDWYNRTKVGDLREATIQQIWQSEEYEQLREWQLTGQFERIPYCTKCTEWQGMSWDYDYFVAMEKVLGKKLL